MYNHNDNNPNRLPALFPFSSPPHSNPLSPSSDASNSLFKILQLNCHNSFNVTLSVLNTKSDSSILILQEPWINPHTLKLPIHSNWLCLLNHNHSPSSYQDKHHTCFLINKKYNSERIHPLPGGSRILSAVDINININKIQTIRFINIYNPPKNINVLPELDTWLNKFNNRKIPSFIFIDSNLHNKLWNPPNYPHSHRESKFLIKTCGQKGFKIISEKGVPTFLTKRSSPTTIDLTWANFLSQKLIHSCITSSRNHASPPSHPIKRLIKLEISNTPSTHLSPIHNILDKHLFNDYDLPSIETIHPHIINPWEDFSLPISNLNVKKEDIKAKVQSQIDQSKSNSEHLIFTDGSNIPKNGAGSAAILDNSTHFSCRINSSEKALAFKAEVQAVIIGLDIFINQHLSSPTSSISTPPINFFVDN
ncbi:hypothetical protein PGT21_031550 [Puccinia graminis f. sp. tritici]|uniref:RNase H type-1 domain-containing protein n=1 Tax=Puccinia graminis f. sp. tritici TaxID=56615 RepID=A0A5B0ME91_PUCGR|nr:hypothetical protein PGT21_030897 [Puccinia graminis f. sp. tritici]KAA1081222.1 hypothetical protein PGT21_031550 [Puccinia graminis f. sp. tritici]